MTTTPGGRDDPTQEPDVVDPVAPDGQDPDSHGLPEPGEDAVTVTTTTSTPEPADPGEEPGVDPPVDDEEESSATARRGTSVNELG